GRSGGRRRKHWPRRPISRDCAEDKHTGDETKRISNNPVHVHEVILPGGGDDPPLLTAPRDGGAFSPATCLAPHHDNRVCGRRSRRDSWRRSREFAPSTSLPGPSRRTNTSRCSIGVSLSASFPQIREEIVTEMHGKDERNEIII